MSKESKNPLFKEMFDLVSSGKTEELEFFVSTHNELLKEDPIQFIGLHVSIYANIEDVNGVLRVVNHYKELPYISMEVEDFLNELKLEMEKLNSRPHGSVFSKEKVEKMLMSNDESAIASALGSLSKQNIRLYLDLIEKFLLSNVTYKYKTLALFILVEQKVNDEIKVEKNGIIYTLEPASLCLPFDDFGYLDCKNYIEHYKTSEDVKQMAIEVMNMAQIKEYPDGFVDLDNYDLMGEIFIQIACGLMHQNEKYDRIASKFNIEVSKIIEMADEIKEIINK